MSAELALKIMKHMSWRETDYNDKELHNVIQNYYKIKASHEEVSQAIDLLVKKGIIRRTRNKRYMYCTPKVVERSQAAVYLARILDRSSTMVTHDRLLMIYNEFLGIRPLAERASDLPREFYLLEKKGYIYRTESNCWGIHGKVYSAT